MTLWDKIRLLIEQVGKLAETCQAPIELTGGATVTEVYAACRCFQDVDTIHIEMEVRSPQTHSWRTTKDKEPPEPPSVEWKIWDGKKHHTGVTLRAAFEEFQQHHTRLPDPEGTEMARADEALQNPVPPF